MNFESQFDVFKQFCQGFSGSGGKFECDELKMEEFAQDDIAKKYESLWNDFVSIRINLLNGKLRQLFEKTLNVNKSQLNKFYKYFDYCRIFCATLPINADDSNAPQLSVDEDNPNPWFEMIRKFDGGDDIVTATTKEIEMFDIGNLNHIYRFIILWNGIFVMMHKRDANCRNTLLITMEDMQLSRCEIKTSTDTKKQKSILYFVILHY